MQLSRYFPLKVLGNRGYFLSHSNCNFSIFVIFNLQDDCCSLYNGLCIITRMSRPPACIKKSFSFTSGLQKENIIFCLSYLQLQQQLILKVTKHQCLYHCLPFSGGFLAITVVPVNHTFRTFPFSNYMVNYFHVSVCGLLWLIVPKVLYQYLHFLWKMERGPSDEHYSVSFQCQISYHSNWCFQVLLTVMMPTWPSIHIFKATTTETLFILPD